MQRVKTANDWLQVAKSVAMMSTCKRRQYGAIIVKNGKIVGNGCNESAKEDRNCLKSGDCFRQINNIPQGKQYEKCVATHAEQNALINANHSDLQGATLFLYGMENGKTITAKSCNLCRQAILISGISQIVGSVENGVETE